MNETARYPLQVWSDEDGNYLSEGHHPADAFISASHQLDLAAFGEELDLMDPADPDCFAGSLRMRSEEVAHVWARFVGECYDQDGRTHRGEGAWYFDVKEGDYNAVPLTLWQP